MKSDKAEQLWLEYRRLMRYIAGGFFADPTDAEDAVSDAFERVLRVIDRFGEVPSPRSKGLVAVITRNVCLDLLRKREPPHDELTETLAADESPADIIITSETVERIIVCINRLSVAYADALRLRVLYEMKDADIAAVLSISHQNARTRLSRARAALNAELKKEGIL